MSEDIFIDLRSNIILLSTMGLLLILLHSIFKRRFERKSLANRQLMGQWDHLVGVAESIEEKVTQVKKDLIQVEKKHLTEPELDWDSRIEVFNFIQNWSEKDQSSIIAALRKEISYAGKETTDVIEVCCDVIPNMLNSKTKGRLRNVLDWSDLQEWSGLPGRLLVFLLAWLKKKGQIIISFIHDDGTFLIELWNATSFPRTELEYALAAV